MRRLIYALALLSGCSAPHELATGDITIEGVTSDGIAIVAERTSGKLIALSLVDQSAEFIFAGANVSVQIFGAIVVIVDNPTDEVAAIFTHANGQIPAPPQLPVENFRAAPDNSTFAFASKDHQIFLQRLGDSPRLATPDALDSQFDFLGDHLVAVVGEAQKLVSIDPVTTAALTLLDRNDCPYQPDGIGRSVLACSNGNTVLVPLDGGSPKKIVDFKSGWIGADGATVFFQDGRDSLLRDENESTDLFLPMDAVCRIDGHSPDDSVMVFSPDCATRALVRLTEVGAAAPVLLGRDDLVPLTFSADERFMLVRSNFDSFGNSDLDAFAVSDGTKLTLGRGITSFSFPDGARVLALAHADKTEVGNLELFDLSQGATPTVIAGNVTSFALAPDGKSVLFTLAGQGLFQQNL
jgi:hypothetical protein